MNAYEQGLREALTLARRGGYDLAEQAILTAIKGTAADAWDEGYDAGQGAVAALFHGREPAENPYR